MSTTVAFNGTQRVFPDDFVGDDGYGYVEIWEQFWADVGADLGFARGLGLLSTTSLTPGTGSKAFTTVPSTVTLPVGAIVQAKSLSDPTHWMVGHVASSSAGALTLTVTAANGGTAKADWVIGNAVAVGDVPRWTVVTGAMTAAHGQRLLVDTSGGAFTIDLSGTPATGDTIEFADAAGTWAAENLTIDANGKTIVSEGAEFDGVCNVSARITLAYNGSEWSLT